MSTEGRVVHHVKCLLFPSHFNHNWRVSIYYQISQKYIQRFLNFYMRKTDKQPVKSGKCQRVHFLLSFLYFFFCFHPVFPSSLTPYASSFFYNLFPPFLSPFSLLSVLYYHLFLNFFFPFYSIHPPFLLFLLFICHSFLSFFYAFTFTRMPHSYLYFSIFTFLSFLCL